MTETYGGIAFSYPETLPGVILPPESRLKKYVELGALPLKSLASELRDSFEAHASNIAIWTTGKTYTYSELDELSDRIAAALLDVGLRPGDRAIFQMRSTSDFYVAFISCLKAGIVPVCSLSTHRKLEIDYLATEAQAKAHFVDGDDPRFDLVGFACETRDRLQTVKHVITVNGGEREGVQSLYVLAEQFDWSEARARLADVQFAPFDPVVFQLSGGTTGVPKIIPRLQCEYLESWRLTIERLGYVPQDKIFMAYPPIHNAAMGCCWGPMLLAGGTVVVPTDLSGAHFAEILNSAEPTWIGQLISGLTPYFKEAEQLGGRFASVRALFQAGSVEMADQARDWLGVETWQMFGMTEGLYLYPRVGDPDEAWARTLGRPLSDHDEVIILEPGTERELPEGEVGEMACRGPFILSGYYNSPERNGEAFTSDGFYRSGDLMVRLRIGEHDFFRFEGRIKDVINRGGEKINATEVENVILRHPSVSQVAVVAYPCERLGERGCAVVVLENSSEPLGLEDLKDFLEEIGLAKFKWPERVEIVKALALTKAGKPDKAEMQRILLETIMVDHGV